MALTQIAGAAKRAARAFPLDWSPRRGYRLCGSSEEGLGPYYIRWCGGNDALGEGWDHTPRDSSGVLLTTPGRFHHPTQIAQYGLEQHARWSESGGGASFGAFIAQARWLRDNQIVHNGLRGSYPHPYAWGTYGAPTGFLSAMTQGEAISVLLRAHECFPNDGYLESAITAATPFTKTIGEGGVVYRDAGDVYLEEVAQDPPAHILNGWIYAHWGLYELLSRTGLQWTRELYEESLDTIVRRLPLYDSGAWSYYNLLATRSGFRKLATLKYHAFHIAQLRVLHSMTENPVFQETADRWESYAGSLRSKVKVWTNAFASLPRHFITHSDTVPAGARSVV